MIRAAAIWLCIAVPAAAQEASLASGAVLRGLDKINGNLTDFELQNGEIAELGRLTIQLNECRYPTDNPSGDAFAHLVIRNKVADVSVFEGWMVASSPALSALDHARYDVWVLRCALPAEDATE